MTTATTLGPVMEREALEALFEGAHTTSRFLDEPVDPQVVEDAYNDLRWAPTAMNAQSLRLTLLRDGETRDAVVEHLMGANRENTAAAPLTLVAAYDPAWHEHARTLIPHREGMREKLEENPSMRETMGRPSAYLQIGYLILALRAHGLAVGPMTGLDPAGVDSVVHQSTGWETLAMINVGHGPDPEHENALRPRAGRLTFSNASQVL